MPNNDAKLKRKSAKTIESQPDIQEFVYRIQKAEKLFQDNDSSEKDEKKKFSIRVHQDFALAVTKKAEEMGMSNNKWMECALSFALENMPEQDFEKRSLQPRLSEHLANAIKERAQKNGVTINQWAEKALCYAAEEMEIIQPA